MDSPDPSKTQSSVGTVFSIYTAPRQPGPMAHMNNVIYRKLTRNTLESRSAPPVESCQIAPMYKLSTTYMHNHIYKHSKLMRPLPTIPAAAPLLSVQHTTCALLHCALNSSVPKCVLLLPPCIQFCAWTPSASAGSPWSNTWLSRSPCTAAACRSAPGSSGTCTCPHPGCEHLLACLCRSAMQRYDGKYGLDL